MSPTRSAPTSPIPTRAALGPRTIQDQRSAADNHGEQHRRSTRLSAGSVTAWTSLTTTRSFPGCRAPCGRLPTSQRDRPGQPSPCRRVNDGSQEEAGSARGPSCHPRAMRTGHWRLLAVTHGHSRHSDLPSLLYRCATARMVRMVSPVRFRRGAPPQHRRSGRVLRPACCMPGTRRGADCQQLVSNSPLVLALPLNVVPGVSIP